MYPKSVYEAMRLSSPQYQQELQEHDEKRQKWERTQTVNGEEWLTEWGVGLLLAEGLGKEGYEARHAADWSRLNQYEFNGELNCAIRQAIDKGDLPAISELRLSSIRAGELGSHTRVLIKKDDFTAWLANAYPTVKWREPRSGKQEKPTPIKGKPETLIAWMKYVIEVEKGLSLLDEMPDGLQARLIEDAEKYGYRDGSSVKKAWSVLGLKSVRKTTKMGKPPKTP